MIEKDFDGITKEDIDALITNGVSEGRSLEYKEQLPGESGDEKREFLADASSFANAGSGDLIYGIREHRDANGKATGTAEAAEGLRDINADAQERRLENLLRDGIDPRIPSVRVKHIDGFAAGPVIILRLPKSWASPHVVRFKNLSRFFSRTSAGKYQLDVREIRAAVLASETLGERISAFRSDRAGRILTGEAPLPLGQAPRFVLHLLPVRGFSEGNAVDLKAAKSAWDSDKSLKPMGRLGQWGPLRFNFSGLFQPGGTGASSQDQNYVQLFRNGAVEAECAWMTNGELLFGAQFEQELVRAAPLFLKLQYRLGLGPSVFVAVSALGVKGFMMSPTLNVSPLNWWPSTSPIDHDVLLAPEVLVEEEGYDIGRLLRPAFDTIWQASGWPGSPGYGESGNWVGFAKHLE